jgi:hypothetical protein
MRNRTVRNVNTDLLRFRAREAKSVAEAGQSWRLLRATCNGWHLAARPDTLHATNRGSNAGDDMRAIQPTEGIARGRQPPNRPTPLQCHFDHEIACKTLPYHLARLGPPPLNALQTALQASWRAPLPHLENGVTP